jgi:hypothetical protein
MTKLCTPHPFALASPLVAKVDLVLYMLQCLYTCIVSICFKCFICFKRTLQVFYLDVTYITLVYTCCKRIFQLFHLVSVYCSRCCSPHVLTCGHARATCTHPTGPISVMQANSNSRTCTQWTASAQMVEHFLVKVHVRMQSARAGQH